MRKITKKQCDYCKKQAKYSYGFLPWRGEFIPIRACEKHSMVARLKQKLLERNESLEELKRQFKDFQNDLTKMSYDQKTNYWFWP